MSDSDATSTERPGHDVSLVELRERLAAAEAALARERSEATALRSRAGELEALLEAVPAHVFIAHDAECRSISGNAYMQRLLRLSPADNASKSAPAVERPAGFIEMRDGVPVAPPDLPMQRAARGDAVTDDELELHFHDGSVRVIFGSAVPLTGDDGQPRGSVGAFVDITERKRLERALREKEATIEAMLHALPVAVALAELPDGRFLDVNEAYVRLVGIPREEILGRTSVEAGLVHDAEGRQRIISHIERNGGVSGAELRLHVRGGRPRDVITYSTLFDWRGKRCILACVLDVTEQRMHEAAIEDLNHRLTRAMAETHHRVKNNLQVIAGLVDILQMEGTETVRIEEVARIGSHVRALASVHDVLTDEIRSGHDVQHVSAEVAFDKLLPLLRGILGDRRLTYTVDDAPLTIRQCSALTVLMNECISNAAKHGGKTVDAAFAHRDGVARLQVTDDGPGFPDGFDPRVNGHTGIGLISSLAEWDLQGRVVFQNPPEGGAQVVVTFALDQP